MRKHVRAEVDASARLEAIVVLADHVAGEYALDGVSDDPDDDKYVAAALEGRAAFVVTGDPDLLEVQEHSGIRLVSPSRIPGCAEVVTRLLVVAEQGGGRTAERLMAISIPKRAPRRRRTLNPNVSKRPKAKIGRMT